MSSRYELPPQGDPDSITCRHCDAVRTIIAADDDAIHRACPTCDAPWVLSTRVTPTWERA